MGEATAEGRLYNRSPRLACLPGVGCRMRESTAEERLYKSGIIIFGEQAVEFIQYIQMAVMLLLIHDI